jgi:AraC-like DNA-binding protein
LFLIVDFLDDIEAVVIPFKNLFFLSFFLIYILFYIVFNYLVLHKNIWSKTSSISFINRQNKIIKKWTLFLFTLLLLMGFRLMLSLILEVTSDDYDYGKSFMWISSSLWLFIFFRILIFPEILNGYSYHTIEMPSKEKAFAVPDFWKKEIGYKITNVQDLQLEKKITNLMAGYVAALEHVKGSTKLLRDSSITLNDMAYRLNIPKSHLTFLFKYYSKASFSEYKKTVRIEDALELIDQGYLKNNTFDSLAKEVGFASYNPFFTSFKEIVGLTPQEYFNSYEHYKRKDSAPYGS